MKLAWVAVAVGLLGCQHDRAGDERNASAAGALGKERGDCRPDKTCDPGLLCLSNLCVRPPPADCALVSEELASLDLGNYAEPEDRAPVVAKYKALCESTYLSKEEGVCLDKAKDKFAAAQCAPRVYTDLGPPCDQVGEKTRAFAARQYRGNTDPTYKKYIDSMANAVKQSCAEDKWSAELVKCVLNEDPNQNIFSYGQCQQQLGPDLQQKMQNRYNTILQQAMK
jgi:hypothetical protein